MYDLKHLERIPKRYTVEARKSLTDDWDLSSDAGEYNLEVYGPNGYFRHFSGNSNKPEPEITVKYDSRKGAITVTVQGGNKPSEITIVHNAYDYKGPWDAKMTSHASFQKTWVLADSGNWYDFSVKLKNGENFLRRFAGRVETGKPGITDPAMALDIQS